MPALVAALLVWATPLLAQDQSVVSGSVVDAATGAAVPDAIVRLAGTTVSAVSDSDGTFVLRGLRVGDHTLEVLHPAYGEHAVSVAVSRPGERFTVVVRVATGGISVEITGATAAAQPGAAGTNPIPVVVTEATLVAPPSTPAMRAGTVLERARIRELAAGSGNVGDLIRRGAPALQVQAFDGAAGDLLCLEFRGTRGRTLNPGLSGGTCNHPQVYLDGVQLMDPEAAYRMTTYDALEWIQVIPPGEAGARFGAAPYGVILIGTSAGRTALGPAGSYAGLIEARRSTFDWSQDPDGHPFLRSLVGATFGNLVGLAAGVAVGERCVYIEEGTRELDTTCPKAGLIGAGLAAVALPALGSAFGANLGGRTSHSRGSLGHALMGAGMAIVPGYAFSLTTVGSGVEETTTAGKVLLVVGSPLLTALADRLFRHLRDG